MTCRDVACHLDTCCLSDIFLELELSILTVAMSINQCSTSMVLYIYSILNRKLNASQILLMLICRSYSSSVPSVL